MIVGATLLASGCESGSRVTDRTDGAGAACQLSKTAITFGTLFVGESIRDTIVVRNVGTSVLIVRPVIQATSRLGGGSAFALTDGETVALTPGQSLPIGIEFRPLDAEDFQAVFLAAPGCGAALTGIGDRPAACAAEPGVLDIGPVVVGTESVGEVVFRNAGGDTLRGEMTLGSPRGGSVALPEPRGVPCDAFSILAGAGPFALARGESLRVEIRFAPTELGEASCVLGAGASECVDVPIVARGDPPPDCEFEPPSLDFGVVAQGETAFETLTIRNTGGGRLEGTIEIQGCDDVFAVTGGGGAFSLLAQETHDVTLAFSPVSAGAAACTLGTGASACPLFTLTGTGDDLPACEAPATTLDMGGVPVGTTASLSFQVRNTGGGTLTGDVSLGATIGSRFAVAQGAGPFALAREEAHTVRVTLTPEGAAGQAMETNVVLGTGLCPGPVRIIATSVDASACAVSPAAFDFGTVFTGSSATRTVSVENTSSATLSIDVSLGSCSSGPFTITAGGGPRSLGAGMSFDIDLRFAPSSAGNFDCAIDLGSACPDLPVFADSEPPPACSLSTNSITFGTIVAGDPPKMRSFDITNVGGGTLTGSVSLTACDTGVFSIDGAGSYALAAGESHTVNVTFDPPAGGSYTCTVVTGCPQNVTVTGQADDPPTCELSTTNLSFGDVGLGCAPGERVFTITNAGDGVLSGVVSENCSTVPFSIVSGAGAFALSAGQSRSVRVRFAPTVFNAGVAGTSYGSAINGCSVQITGGCAAVSWSARSVVSFACDLTSRFGSTTCTRSGCHPTSASTDWRVYGNVVANSVHPGAGDIDDSAILRYGRDGCCGHPGGSPLATSTAFRERFISWLLNGCPNN